MAMERPIVSTSIGAEGLPVQHESELLLADTPEDFAESVVRVLTDQELGEDLARRAARLVREQFGWDRVATRFAEICDRHGDTAASVSVIAADQELEAVTSFGKE